MGLIIGFRELAMWSVWHRFWPLLNVINIMILSHSAHLWGAQVAGQVTSHLSGTSDSWEQSFRRASLPGMGSCNHCSASWCSALNAKENYLEHNPWGVELVLIGRSEKPLLLRGRIWEAELKFTGIRQIQLCTVITIGVPVQEQEWQNLVLVWGPGLCVVQDLRESCICMLLSKRLLPQQLTRNYRNL